MSAVPPELPGDAPVARVLMRKLRSTVLLTLDMRRTYWQRKRCGSACSSRVFVHAPSARGSQLCRPLCGFLCALLFPIFTFQFFKNSTSKMVCQLKTFCHVLQSSCNHGQKMLSSKMMCWAFCIYFFFFIVLNIFLLFVFSESFTSIFVAF